MTHTPHAASDPSLDVIPSTQDLPVLPYGVHHPTSGHSGTDTSAERARHDDETGLTGRRQRQVLTILESLGAHGITWKELANTTGYHHGQASGSLSNLHKAGLIVRLSERRERCKVYVATGYAEGREIEPYAARRAGLPHRGDAVEAWIKRERDQYAATDGGVHPHEWTALDYLLDKYRLAADTGQSLNEKEQS